MNFAEYLLNRPQTMEERRTEKSAQYRNEKKRDRKRKKVVRQLPKVQADRPGDSNAVESVGVRNVLSESEET